eukprot:6921400-Prymnesium_polylepis.1
MERRPARTAARLRARRESGSAHAARLPRCRETLWFLDNKKARFFSLRRHRPYKGTRHAADVHRCTPKVRHSPPPCHGA